MRYLILIIIMLAMNSFIVGCQSTDVDEEGWVEAGYIPPPDAPKPPKPETSDEAVAEAQQETTTPVQREVSSSEPKAFAQGLNSFQSDCKMRKDADETSEKVGFIKKGKKLWVDKHNDSWGKVYRKSGPAFVSLSCF